MDRDAGPRQDERHDLEIVTAFADCLVFEQRLESTEHEIRFQLYGCGRARQQIVPLVLASMSDRDVSPLPVGSRHGNPDDGRAHRVGLIGDYVDRELPGRS